MFKQQKTIKFIKDFSSPILGNVWIDRVVSDLDNKTAERFVKLGYAVDVTDEKTKPSKKEDKESKLEKVDDDAAADEGDDSEHGSEQPDTKAAEVVKPAKKEKQHGGRHKSKRG